jgi:pimeloyl-ACP methyl ester carboxylesterase
MPYVNVHGVNLFYEEYGQGPAVILTPGGRVDRNGLRPIAALLSPRCRVILHDRRNCGRSDVVIGGELSEQHLWAEEMAGLLVQIDATPAYAAGGSAGSRTSLTLAVRHPEVVKGVLIWEVSGGPKSGGGWPRLLRAIYRGGRTGRDGRGRGNGVLCAAPSRQSFESRATAGHGRPGILRGHGALGRGLYRPQPGQ